MKCLQNGIMRSNADTVMSQHLASWSLYFKGGIQGKQKDPKLIGVGGGGGRGRILGSLYLS